MAASAPPPRSSDSIAFVGAGARPAARARGNPQNLLSGAADWKVLVDLRQILVFPDHITKTRLRPDIVLWSDSTRRLVVGELTVPLESNVLAAHERKSRKYEDLVLECERAGWRTHFFAVEVGCRGFPTSSLSKFLSSLGLAGRRKSQWVDKICDKAESASFWVWCKRAHPWDPGPLRPTIQQ